MSVRVHLWIQIIINWPDAKQVALKYQTHTLFLFFNYFSSDAFLLTLKT